jgi:hypothetical protein
MLWVTQMGVEGYLFNSTYVCVFILDKMPGDISLMGTGVQISKRHWVVSSDQLLLLPEPSFMHNRQMVLGQLKIPRTPLIHSYSAGGILWLIWTSILVYHWGLWKWRWWYQWETEIIHQFRATKA